MEILYCLFAHKVVVWVFCDNSEHSSILPYRCGYHLGMGSNILMEVEIGLFLSSTCRL